VRKHLQKGNTEKTVYQKESLHNQESDTMILSEYIFYLL